MTENGTRCIESLTPMTVFAPPRRRPTALGLASGLSLAFAFAVAGEAHAADDGSKGNSLGDALQVIADVTLIDGSCKDVTVNFGAVFRFAAQQGLAISSVMPTGSRRADFERVLQARQVSFDRDELCGQVALNYAEALPGSITGVASRNADRR